VSREAPSPLDGVRVFAPGENRNLEILEPRWAEKQAYVLWSLADTLGQSSPRSEAPHPASPRIVGRTTHERKGPDMAELITELQDADIRTEFTRPRGETVPGDDDATDPSEGGDDGGADDDADGTDSADDASDT
jgi:hypothetical protein